MNLRIVFFTLVLHSQAATFQKIGTPKKPKKEKRTDITNEPDFMFDPVLEDHFSNEILFESNPSTPLQFLKPEAPKPIAAKPKPITPAPKPKIEAPKTEAPKPEAPKPEAPKPEAPKPEAPPLVNLSNASNNSSTISDLTPLNTIPEADTNINTKGKGKEEADEAVAADQQSATSGASKKHLWLWLIVPVTMIAILLFYRWYIRRYSQKYDRNSGVLFDNDAEEKGAISFNGDKSNSILMQNTSGLYSLVPSGSPLSGTCEGGNDLLDILCEISPVAPVAPVMDNVFVVQSPIESPTHFDMENQLFQQMQHQFEIAGKRKSSTISSPILGHRRSSRDRFSASSQPPSHRRASSGSGSLMYDSLKRSDSLSSHSIGSQRHDSLKRKKSMEMSTIVEKIQNLAENSTLQTISRSSSGKSGKSSEAVQALRSIITEMVVTDNKRSSVASTGKSAASKRGSCSSKSSSARNSSHSKQEEILKEAMKLRIDTEKGKLDFRLMNSPDVGTGSQAGFIAQSLDRLLVRREKRLNGKK